MHDAEISYRPEPFRLGEWDVYPALNRIEGSAGEIRQLEPKVMRVLQHLASRPGEVIGQEEMIDAVWGGVAVSPNVLTYSIAALRKALDDDWRAPRYVETISKSGYRLVEPVARLGSAAGGAPESAQPLAGSRPRGGVALWTIAGVATLAALARFIGGGAGAGDARSATMLQPVPATALPGSEIHPALSPDGNHLAFAWRPEGSDHYDLYVKLIGSEAAALLVGTPAQDVSPAWTPDGLQIAYVSRDANGCGIFQIPATGGASRRLADCPGRPIGNLSFATDGTRLAIGSGRPGEPTKALVLDLASGKVRALAEPPPTAQGDYYPMFSPDGRRASFHRIRGDGLSDLYVVDAAGGAVRRLTADNRDIGGHDWMADGKRLLFSSYRTGQFRLWSIDADGGEPQPVAINDHQMTSVSLSRTGHRLAYYRSATETNLWSSRLGNDGTAWDDASSAAPASVEAIPWAAPGPPSSALSSTRWEAHPHLASSGARVAFASDRSGTFEIWSANLDGSDPLRHTAFGGPFVGAPRYSPDDRRIVFDARPDGHADLWSVDARGSDPRRLTDHPGDEFAPSYSRDGRWIYFTSDRGGSWQIWRTPAAGGPATQVTASGAYRALEGPDGFLYYVKAGAPGIWRAALSTKDGLAGEETPVLPRLPLIDWGSWSVTDRGLVLLVRSPTAVVLWELPGERLVPLMPLPNPPPRQHPALAASADARLLIYALVDRRETDIMLIDGLR